MYEEDFYNEHSEFDQQIDEFKQGLIKAVKQEYTAEMERLRSENAELQTIKRDFEKIQQDYRNKERQLEIDKRDLINTVRRERLGALMKDFQVIVYKPYSKRVLPPKCEMCDEKRKVPFTTPLGRQSIEDCICSIGKLVYEPQECLLSEFKINRNENGMTVWYKMKSDRDEDWAVHESSIHADAFYNSCMNYPEIKQYGTYFKTTEECQGYCDWLTEQAALKTNSKEK